MKDPLTLRYNNPGALEFKPWMSKYGGRLGQNGRYAAFDNPDQGYQAMGQVLDTYQLKHGLNTVRGIVNRWAPRSVDNNSTDTYASKVAQGTGVGLDDPLTPSHRPALMRSMAAYEAGRAPAPLGMIGAPPTGGAPPATAPAPQGQPPMATASRQFMTPEEAAARRRMAGGMIQEGMSSAPVKHWTQGAARVIQGMAGNAWMNRVGADERDRVASERGEDAAAATKFIQGMAGGPPQATAPRAPAATPEERIGGGLMSAPQGMAGPPDRFAGQAAALMPMASNPRLQQFAMQRAAALGDRRMAESDPRRLQEMDLARSADGRAAAAETRAADMHPLNMQRVQAEIANKETPDKLFRLREQEAQRAGLQAGSPAYQSYVLTGKVGRDEPMQAGDKTRIEKAENEWQKTDDAMRRLQVAQEANKQAHQGWFPDARATLGNNLPDWLVPDFIASPESSKATRTYSDLMTQEAVKIMGDDLTGASTDFEMRKYMEIVADTTKPREIRADALQRMMDRGERNKSLQRNRIDDIRGGQYFAKGYKPSLDSTGSGGPVRVQSVEEARRLPSGTKIILPDGSPGRVP